MINFDWHKVWQKKALEETDDMRVLDGWENIDPKYPEEVATKIKSRLNIKDTDTVLEVGCGAGLLSKYFGEKYIGVDYSRNMVQKNIQINHRPIICCEASDLIFKDKSFDVVFAYSVFQYFPSLEYANSTISEMERVSKGKIYIGDLPESSHDKNHLLFSIDNFWEWTTTVGIYNEDRFDAIKGITLKNTFL